MLGKSIFISLYLAIFSAMLHSSESAISSSGVIFNERLRQNNSVFSADFLEASTKKDVRTNNSLYPVTTLEEYRKKRNPVFSEASIEEGAKKSGSVRFVTALEEYRRKRNPITLEEHRRKRNLVDSERKSNSNSKSNQFLMYRHDPYMAVNVDLSKKLAALLLNSN